MSVEFLCAKPLYGLDGWKSDEQSTDRVESLGHSSAFSTLCKHPGPSSRAFYAVAPETLDFTSFALSRSLDVLATSLDIKTDFSHR